MITSPFSASIFASSRSIGLSVELTFSDGLSIFLKGSELLNEPALKGEPPPCALDNFFILTLGITFYLII